MDNIFGKKNIISNISWKLIERFSSLIISLLINIILARLLLPSDFGLLAMVNVVVAIIMIFVTSGLSNSLIQKQNSDSLDFSSLFWFNLLLSLLLYIILFFIAPLIAQFYGNMKLTAILRMLGLQIPIAAVYSIQNAIVAKNMMFRYYFYSTLLGKILSGIFGIILAYMGFGIWALVIQSVSLLFFETVLLSFKINWRPQKKFSWQRVKTLYPFALKLMLRSFIEAARNQLQVILIGNNYSSSQLAFYDRGNLLPTTITTNLSTSTSAVMFPVIADKQDQLSNVLSICRRWLKIFSYIGLPLLTGLILIATPLIEVLLTKQWLPLVPYLQIASGVYMSWTIEVPIRETLNSIGHSNATLHMEIYKTLISIVILFFTINISVLAVAIGVLISSFINILISTFYAYKYFEYKPKYIFQDIMPTFILCLLASLSVGIMTEFISDIHIILDLFFRILLAVGVFIAGSILSKNENFIYILNILKKR